MKKVAISDDILNRFIQLFEATVVNQFAIGDLLELTIATHEDVYTKQEIVNYIAGHLRISPSTLYDYHRVAMLWTPDLRQQYQSLDWTFYRLTDPTDQQEMALLDQAIDDGWNATQYKKALYPKLTSPEAYMSKIAYSCRQALEAEDLSEFYREAFERIMEIIGEITNE